MRKEHSGSREWQGKDTMLVSNELGGSGQKEGCGLERDETGMNWGQVVRGLVVLMRVLSFSKMDIG